KPLFSFMVIGLNGRLPLNTAGNLQKLNDGLIPVFDQAEHLGTSPSELDLRFALQNAFDGTFAYTQFDDAAGPGTQSNDPTVGGVSVALTQLRNILAGTRPYVAGANQDSNVVNTGPADANGVFAMTNLPNGVGDQKDAAIVGANPILRTTPAVGGRW